MGERFYHAQGIFRGSRRSNGIVSMTIQGAKEIEQMLSRLGPEAVKIARKESRDAQKAIMLPAVKSNAVKLTTGSASEWSDLTGIEIGAEIAKQLAVRTMRGLRRGSVGHKLVIKPTDQFVHIAKSGNRSYIPNAIEYGHAAPGHAGGLKIVGPKPFQREAYENKWRSLFARFEKQVIALIQKAAKAR